MFTADRNENVIKNILPALTEGKLVICDRFYDSTVAYQQYGNGLDPALVKSMNKISTNGLVPDITFWIDTPVKTCHRRNQIRKDKSSRYNSSASYQSSVRDGYNHILFGNPDRVVRINGDVEPATVNVEIMQHLSKLLDKTTLSGSFG
jgi:dTMP kinase